MLFGATPEPLHCASGFAFASFRVSCVVPLSHLHSISLCSFRSGVSPGPYEPPALRGASLAPLRGLYGDKKVWENTAGQERGCCSMCCVVLVRSLLCTLRSVFVFTPRCSYSPRSSFRGGDPHRPSRPNPTSILSWRVVSFLRCGAPERPMRPWSEGERLAMP